MVVVVVATLVLPPGDSRSSPAGSRQATLTAGEETQVGCTGSNGCPEGVRELDVYKLGMPIPADALTVAEGSTMTFEYGGENGEVSPYCEVSSLDNNDGYSLNCKSVGDRVEVPADLAPGEYGLKISITPESVENAELYGFHLKVE